MSSDSFKYPHGSVLYRNLDRQMPVVSHGEGPYLFDKSGKRYFDASGGALVNSLGHGCKELVAAISDQLSKVAYVNGHHFTSSCLEELSERLCKAAPKGLNRVVLLGSGSEAIEAAVKFVRQLWVERGEAEREIFVSRNPGYHGNTLFALSASARPHYKKFFGPLLLNVPQVSAPYEYRFSGGDYQGNAADFYAKELDELVHKLGPKKIAGFLLETVGGSSTGASVPPPGYFEKISKVCKKHGILMIADEVMCGTGRTGKFFAAEHFGFEPDLLVLGKGINAGMMPVSVLMVKDEQVQEMKKGSGGFMHAQTYMQSPSLAATGLAVIRYFEKHKVLENCSRQGVELLSDLRSKLAEHPNVGFVSGLGLMLGVELVEDKKTKRPFDRSKKTIEKFVNHAFHGGLVLWPNTGQADGVNGDLFMLGPPLNISAAQTKELASLVCKNIEEFF